MSESTTPAHAASEETARAALLDARPVGWFRVFMGAMVRLHGDTLDVVYFVERPEKWAREYVAWCNAGHPQHDSDPGWERFAEDVEGLA